jgi:hypothetical protein
MSRIRSNIGTKTISQIIDFKEVRSMIALIYMVDKPPL